MKKIARRQFLKTTAAVSVLGAVTSAGAVPAGACIDLSQARIPALDPFRLDGTFTGSDGHTFSYASYEPAGAKGAPLVVWLHSGEECGTDVRIPLLAEKVTALAGAPVHLSAWEQAPEQAVNVFYRNRVGTVYCHEGDWSWIYFFNGQCADPATGEQLWQWLGQQKR